MIINKENIKKYSLFPLNYTADELMPFIDLCEMKYVVPMIGDELYDIIVEETASSGAVSERISTLLVEALWPYLGTCICYEFLPFAYVKITEVGLTVGHSENSDPAGLPQVTYLQSNLRANLEARKKFLFNWLVTHDKYFPEWVYDEGCGCGPLPVNCCSGGPTQLKPEPMKPFYSPAKTPTNIQ